ncbi:MAG: hypothetical protein PHD70_06635 [Anaerostipes sp.]|nr:hypothetical protein [Anaerostipes sp.]
MSSDERKIAPVHLISYLTQKLLLTAIYDKWQEVTVTEASRRLEVSKMSMSRCFDEIEYLNIDVIRMKGKSRVVCVSKDRKILWEQMNEVLWIKK